ncbi:MAG: putative sulfate exporter family transporter [candidate division NC10 bacterium]|nr:putative sulfate exporter family transporter [candidate division NC10 bacterium]
MSDRVLTSSDAVSLGRPEPSKQWVWWSASLLLVVLLTVATWKLNKAVPAWSKSLRVIEFPVYAVLLGLLAGGILSLLRIKERLAAYFRTEFFLKTGLVLLGATINLTEIAAFGVKGLLQAVILITTVFFFTWFVARWLGVEEKLRALLAASVAICGVSAAITAAGAVLAKKEQLAYVTGLVILFALPLMFLQPAAALWLNLSPNVAGAWIGGNIDTTAAVVGAGTIHSQQALKVASIAKLSQNALIGVVAFLLALYWVVVVERKPGQRPSAWEIWERFPKFVLGFILASIVVTLALSNGWIASGVKRDIGHLREWFFMAAFLSIGFDLSFRGLREAGWRPIGVYALATAFNTLVALGAASLIFG